MVASFNDLTREELYRSALEDFAVDVKETDSKKVLLAALVEAGVTWDLYLKGHPELAPKAAENTVVVEPRHNPAPVGVVTADAQKEAPVVRTAEAPVQSQSDLYLVKMNRDNPYFEFGKYKFTKDKPFAVMDADSTNDIITEEEGFAIATPAEARAFYGL